MPQNITYTVGDGLYINMTNRCTCDCDFCIRRYANSVGSAESLWLDDEPTREEVLESVMSRDLTEYSELVFCGYGEPLIRADDLLWIAGQVKQAVPELPIRVNTNGHANMIAGYDVTPGMAGVIDHVSVSLNNADAEAYNKSVRPVYGTEAYAGLLDFAEKAKSYVPKITLTVLNCLPPDEIERCREIAGRLGVGFRVRGME
jgi:TatD family-associated radical SAM protein